MLYLWLGCADEGGLQDEAGDEDGLDDDEAEISEVHGPNQDAATSQAQIISTACWLTMKEAAMLTGTLMQVVPLSGQAFLERDH